VKNTDPPQMANTKRTCAAGAAMGQSGIAPAPPRDEPHADGEWRYVRNEGNAQMVRRVVASTVATLAAWLWWQAAIG
jgi:hypothetical protein